MSVLSVLIVSCSAPGDASVEEVSRAAAATAEPTAEAQPVPEGVVASGAFTSTDGSTTGDVEIVVTGDLAELVLREFASTHERLGVRAPFDRSATKPCVDDGAFAFPDIVTGRPTDPLIMPVSIGRGDPTFVTEIALTVSARTDDISDCMNQVVASAPLVWIFGPQRPSLDTLFDAGTRGGANGEVVIDAAGRPVAYTVAPDDLLPEVADRFGITSDDVFYLNPVRLPSSEDPLLYVDEVLNLDLRGR